MYILAGIPFLLLLLWAVWIWRKRQIFMHSMRDEHCPLCKESFEDALCSYLGGISAEEMDQLDRFQQRFARYRVCCGNCGAIVICTADGKVVKGYWPDGHP